MREALPSRFPRQLPNNSRSSPGCFSLTDPPAHATYVCLGGWGGRERIEERGRERICKRREKERGERDDRRGWSRLERGYGRDEREERDDRRGGSRMERGYGRDERERERMRRDRGEREDRREERIEEGRVD